MSNTSLVDDRFTWVKGLNSDPDVWTLQDPNHRDVAQIYPLTPAFCIQQRLHYEALTEEGQIIGSYDTLEAAIVAVNNACRHHTSRLADDVDVI